MGQGGGDVDQGGGDGGGDVDAKEPKDDDLDAMDPEDADMEPGDRDEDPDKDRGVKKEGPASETSHFSGRSVEDVCGDCGRRRGTCSVQGKRRAEATPVLGAGVPAMPDEAPVAARRGAMGRVLQSVPGQVGVSVATRGDALGERVK